jgi:hypothetical protein
MYVPSLRAILALDPRRFNIFIGFGNRLGAPYPMPPRTSRLRACRFTELLQRDMLMF